MTAAYDNAPIGLVKLAQDALAQSNYDRPAALVLLESWILSDRDLYDLHVLPAITELCERSLRDADQRTRRQLRAVPTKPPTMIRLSAQFATTPAQLSAILDRQERDWYLWALPGGKRLGPATPADVQAGIDHHAANERGHGRERRFLELVKAEMHGGSSVEKTIPRARLAQLRKQADEEV